MKTNYCQDVVYNVRTMYHLLCFSLIHKVRLKCTIEATRAWATDTFCSVMLSHPLLLLLITLSLVHTKFSAVYYVIPDDDYIYYQ